MNFLQKAKAILFAVVLGTSATQAGAPWRVTNPEGDVKFTLYQKAQDSVTVRINYGRAGLKVDATMKVGGVEYKETSQAYYIIVPKYMKQKLVIWRKDDAGDKIELQIPSLEAKQLIEFNISEDVLNTEKKEGKGKWSLETTPTGAHFQFDGLPIEGTTPSGASKDFNVQTYKVLITKDRYKPVEVLLDVQKDETISKTILLEPSWADVEFVTNIPEAQLTINEHTYTIGAKAPFRLFGESEGLMAQRYDYAVESPGSATIKGFIDLSPGEKRSVPINVNLEWGNLNFTSIPDACQVVVNGENWGTTPFLREKVPVGAYRASFQKEGYEPRQATFSVDRFFQDVKMNLALTSGNLHLVMEPGSKVTLDGQIQSAGQQDFSGLSVTAHKVEVTHPDYELWSGEISIFEEQQQFTVPQKAKPATLNVAGNISGATVMLDGVTLGVAPLQALSLAGSKASATLHVEKSGFTGYDTTITLYPNSKLNVQYFIEDMEERDARERQYTRYEDASPLELGLRTGPGGIIQYGVREGNFVWSRGLSVGSTSSTFSEYHASLNKLNDRIEAVDVRLNIYERGYGVHLKTPQSFLVAEAGVAAMLAPTVHFNLNDQATDSYTYKLSKQTDYSIYMKRGFSLDLLALKAMVGINLHPLLSVYAGAGIYGGLLSASAVSSVLNPGLDTNSLSTLDREDMATNMKDARKNYHPYMYNSVSLGMNLFLDREILNTLSGEPIPEWWEAITASWLWGGYSGDYGMGWDLSLGKVDIQNLELGGLALTADIFPMRYNNHTYGLWLSKAGVAKHGKFLFLDAMASFSLGYGWNWDLPKTFAEELYGMTQTELQDSLLVKVGSYSTIKPKVKGTKYFEFKLGLSQRILDRIEFFGEVYTEYGNWTYYDASVDFSSGEELKRHYGWSPLAIAAGIKLMSVTAGSED
jgi:hypothetical protein